MGLIYNTVSLQGCGAEDGESQKCSLAPLIYLTHIIILVIQMVKNRPAMRETWVQSLGWKEPLEEGMAAHSSTPAWRIPWTEEPVRLQSMGSERVRRDQAQTAWHGQAAHCPFCLRCP